MLLKPQTALLSLLLLGLSGCISYKSERNTLTQAIPAESVLAEVQLGTTTTDWLLEQLGPPQAVRRPDPDTFVWQYENVATSRKAIRALPLLAITLEDSHATVYNFEVQNNYIVKYWKDNQ